MRILVLFATTGTEVAELEVEPSTTVFSLHCEIAALTNFPVIRQRLFRGSEALLGSVSLEESGIVDHDHLQLVVVSHIVCTWGAGNSVKLCCAATGECIETLQGCRPEFTEDGSMVLTQTDHDTAVIWNASTCGPLQTIRTHNAITHTKFSRDGSLVLTSHTDDTVRIWNSSTGVNLQTLAGNGGTYEIQPVSISPDGSMVVTTTGVRDEDGRVWGVDVWNVATGEQICSEYFNDTFADVFFSPVSSMLCATGEWGTKIWNPSSGELQFSSDGMDAVFSSDGSKLITLDMSEAGLATIWDVNTFEPLQLENPQEHEREYDSQESLQFSTDGSLVLYIGGNGTTSFIVWSASTGECLQQFNAPFGGTDAASIVHGGFSRDNSLVLASILKGPQSAIHIWSVQTGQWVAEFPPGVPLEGALLF